MAEIHKESVRSGIPFNNAVMAGALMLACECDDNDCGTAALINGIRELKRLLRNPGVEKPGFDIWDAIGSYCVLVELPETEAQKLQKIYDAWWRE